MKTTFYLVLILATSLPYYLRAQGQIPAPPLITVNGYGVVKVRPDESQVSISIQLQDESVNTLSSLIDKRSSDVIKILQDANITNGDIESSNVSIWPYYSGTSSSYGSSGPSYYLGKKSLTFTLRNISNYDSVMAKLYGVNISSIDSVVFQLSNSLLQAKKLEARKNAAANAKQVLDTLVEGLGLQIGDAYTVSESTSGGDPQSFSGYSNSAYNVVANSSEAVAVSYEVAAAEEVAVVVDGGADTNPGSSSAPSILAQDFTITSTVYAQYYIV